MRVRFHHAPSVFPGAIGWPGAFGARFSLLANLLFRNRQKGVAVGEEAVHFALVAMLIGQNDPVGLVHLHKSHRVSVRFLPSVG
jgi:hypothetical protein